VCIRLRRSACRTLFEFKRVRLSNELQILVQTNRSARGAAMNCARNSVPHYQSVIQKPLQRLKDLSSPL